MGCCSSKKENISLNYISKTEQSENKNKLNKIDSKFLLEEDLKSDLSIDKHKDELFDHLKLVDQDFVNINKNLLEIKKIADLK